MTTWPALIDALVAPTFYALSAFGLAYIVGHSRISLPFRLWLARPTGPSRGGHVYCPWCPGSADPHVCCLRCTPARHICLRAAYRGGKPIAIPDEYRDGPNHVFACSSPGGGIYDGTDCYTPPPRSAVRDWLLELIECPMCFGTWTGLAVGLALPTLLPMELPRVSAGIALATFTAATNYLLGRASGLVPPA